MDGGIYRDPAAHGILLCLTDRSGALTLANILAIGSSEHLKALWLSLLLAGVSSVICLILAYPLALILR